MGKGNLSLTSFNALNVHISLISNRCCFCPSCMHICHIKGIEKFPSQVTSIVPLILCIRYSLPTNPRSASTKPSSFSSQSANVLMGILCFSRVPGLVNNLPFNLNFVFSFFNNLSIVAGLISINFFFVSSSMLTSLHFFNTGIISVRYT